MTIINVKQRITRIGELVGISAPPKKVEQPVQQVCTEESPFRELELFAAQNKANIIADVNKNYLYPKMDRVLENIQIANVSVHHNGALDLLDVAKSRGIVKEPLALIHFDTHSDAYNSPPEHTRDENIGNWINKAISDGSVGEVYWVLPEWTKQPKYEETFWCGYPGSTVFLDPPNHKQFYVDKNDRIHFKKPIDYLRDPQKYKVVKFHKITVDQLPDLTGNNNVMMDICGDYFVNSGYDTTNRATNYIADKNKMRQEVYKSYYKIFDEMDKKGIKPIIYNGAESPYYVPKFQLNFVTHLLQKIILKSGNGTVKKELLEVRHSDSHGMVNRSKTCNLPRQGHYFGDILTKLLYIETASPSHLFDEDNEPAYRMAVRAVANHYRTDEKTARKMLDFFRANLTIRNGSTHEMMEKLAGSNIDYAELFRKEFNLDKGEIKNS